MGIQSAASKDLAALEAARQAALEAARQAALEAARAAREAMAAAMAALRASLAAQSDQNIGSGSPAEPMPASAIGGSPFIRSAADFDDIAQGQTGDCWFLSTINALNEDPEDRQFLEEAVVVLEDPETGESIYHVSLYDRDGRQVTTEISQDDIDAAQRDGFWLYSKVSSRDDHVVALQLAAIEMLGASEYNGGNFKEALAMLGVNIEQITITTDLDTALDQIANDPDGAVAVFDTSLDYFGRPIPSDGDSAHQWTITDYDPATQTITYLNPWNTNKIHTISKEDFIGLDVYNIQVLDTGLAENSPPDYLWTIKDGSERGQELGDPLLGELGDNRIMELPEGARSEINQYINLHGLDMSAENDVKQAEEKLTEILRSQYGIEYYAAEVEFAGVNQGSNSVIEVNYRVEAVNAIRIHPLSPAQESILINMTNSDYSDFRAEFDPHASEVGAFNLAVYLVTDEVLDQNVERLDEYILQNNDSGSWSMARGLEFILGFILNP